MAAPKPTNGGVAQPRRPEAAAIHEPTFERSSRTTRPLFHPTTALFDTVLDRA